ncbi:candidapepsin [[Candida] railenensis]|uniref:candidapepsin n=1 Tax=[Candida] railenensis TaxID=45579 RepID=A0A9P0QNA7_9ASCO|nr:candidapepsin [[Candida] railenensis]
MVSFSAKTFAAIALYISTFVSAAPTVGLSIRAPKVVGLDFETKSGKSLNSTSIIHKRDDDEVTLTNEGLYYIAYLEFGSNGQSIGVDIDTGSSDLWVPDVSLKGQKVAQYGTFDSSSSSSFQDPGLEFSITYGDHTTTQGNYGIDTVKIGDASLSNFQFAIADSTSVNNGILGIGLTALEAPVYDGYGPEYDNLPVALKKAGIIDSVQYSLYLNDPNSKSGSVLFGGKDLAKIDGDLVTLEHSGDAARLDVTLDSLTLKGQNIDVNAAFNLDSGTAITYFSDDVYNSFLSIIGGDGSLYQDFLPIVPCQTSGNLSYNFKGVTINVPLTSIVKSIGDGSCAAYFVGGGDNILGASFLPWAYLVYDLENSQISIAQAKFTSDSNIVSL